MCDCGKIKPNQSNSVADMARQWQGLPGSSPVRPDPFWIGSAGAAEMASPRPSVPKGLMPGAQALVERIHSLRNEVEQLEALRDSLPARLSLAADAALYNLIWKHRAP